MARPQVIANIGYGAIGVAAALALWEIGGRLLGDALFAPLSSVLVEYVALVRDGTMLTELALSLRQMVLGYALACLIGMPIGILMGRSAIADAIFHPWLSMFVVTSVAALVPLFVLLFGVGFAFRVAVVFTAVIWYIMLTVYHGARGVEPRFLEVGRSFGAGPWQSFWNILLPALYPYLITGARIGLVHAIRAMVVAEMFIIVGYGRLLQSSGYAMSTAPLLSLLLTLSLLGVAANLLLLRAGRLLAPWYQERISGAAVTT
jgi:ABC-type nitrate/sulfonate/bicarbonate transport system permease component